MLERSTDIVGEMYDQKQINQILVHFSWIVLINMIGNYIHYYSHQEAHTFQLIFCCLLDVLKRLGGKFIQRSVAKNQKRFDGNEGHISYNLLWERKKNKYYEMKRPV